MTTFTASDYLQLLQNLLPPGVAFPRDPSTVQTAFLQAVADNQATAGAREANLLTDAFPSTTDELLPEWEKTVGLPDPCWGPDVTVDQRRAAVLARIIGQGGQSIPYFIAFATNLGFPGTTFREFACFRVGMQVGLPINGPAWAYALQINNPTLTGHYFQVGIDTTGDPLSSFNGSALICELRRILPGHVVPLFNFIITRLIPGGGESDTPLYPDD